MAQSFKENFSKNLIKYKEIECVINGEESVKCRREAKDVYMPFSFIQRYFEVSWVVQFLYGIFSDVIPPNSIMTFSIYK